MKLWNKFKRLMPNKKKPRERKVEIFPSPVLTEAERLIMNNWNIVVANPTPSMAGKLRAAERLRKKQLANKLIPVSDKPISRQVRRQAERRDFKALRAMVLEEHRKNKRQADQIEKGLIPT